MRKIRIIEHISLDGIIQGPGGPEEDVASGFNHGGWAVPHHDQAVGEAIDAAQGAGFDLLLGRKTYDIFASYWPHQTGAMADSLNSAHKFVATHRPDSLAWGPAESLGLDVVQGVRQVKSAEGPDLVVWGSSTLTPLLLHHSLADEVLLLVFPVLIGRGKRFFSETSDPRELSLVHSEVAASGVVMNTYRPAGPMRTGTFDPEPA
ncbi:MAG: dihydrofolate reductase family protein [Nitratireductor sp.]|jgi:dihydrofolate reductase|nr:dihydrofolate reductase family protein [Nitratireductor sp.]